MAFWGPRMCSSGAVDLTSLVQRLVKQVSNVISSILMLLFWTTALLSKAADDRHPSCCYWISTSVGGMILMPREGDSISISICCVSAQQSVCCESYNDGALQSVILKLEKTLKIRCFLWRNTVTTAEGKALAPFTLMMALWIIENGKADRSIPS